jgi:sugar O-acyltransferase (sialic acid O-acetyltransferase NeuD family)
MRLLFLVIGEYESLNLKEGLELGKIILYGNGAVAKETFFNFKYYSDHEVVGFTVDREYLESDFLFELPVVPFDTVKTVFPVSKYDMLIAVGYVQNNKIRKEKYLQSKQMGYRLVNFISPNAILYPGEIEGDNCCIMHHAVISYNVKIGSNVFIGNSCSIGHDVVIDDHCFFSNDVSIAGWVTIGSFCYVGPNSTIRNKVSIGKECVIGAGALILENVEDRSVYLGSPATLLPITSDKLSLG